MSEVGRSNDLFRRRSGASVKLVLASWGDNDVRGHVSLSGVYVMFCQEKIQTGRQGIIWRFFVMDVSGNVFNCRKGICLEGLCGLEE